MRSAKKPCTVHVQYESIRHTLIKAGVWKGEAFFVRIVIETSRHSVILSEVPFEDRTAARKHYEELREAIIL